jgi:hypothetical protein
VTGAEALRAVARERAFLPRRQFAQLAHDHVAFDALLGRDRYEAVALRSVVADPLCVSIVGPVGGGKSSLIAYVCQRLPETHVALRVPVTGADDPTSVSVVAALALSQAISAIEMEQYQRDALERARADTVTVDSGPGKALGGRLGGGPIPAEVHAEVATLREQLARNQLAGDRLSGLDRLITLLVARGLQPVFVLEDTEAAVGGGERTEVVEAFFGGPVRAFMNELEAPCLLAVQDGIATSPTFNELAPHMQIIEVPSFEDPQVGTALGKIVAHRLSQFDISVAVQELVGDEALELLVSFYEETGRSLRHVLAALQSASEYANDTGAAQIGAGHVRAATSDWRAIFRRSDG